MFDERGKYIAKVKCGNCEEINQIKIPCGTTKKVFLESIPTTCKKCVCRLELPKE